MTTFITFIGSIISLLLGWRIGRRKSEAETKKLEAEARKTDTETEGMEIVNVKEMVKFYRDLTADLQDQIKIVNENCEKLSIRCKELTHEIELLREENVEQRLENSQLKQQLKKLTDRLWNNNL